MPIISQPFYFDGSSLSSSSSIYMDDIFSVCAPDGYYSDGTVVRQQVNCHLLPEQPCPDCGLPCDISIVSEEDNSGIFRIDSTMQGTNAGAIKIWFDPIDVPEGIFVFFNSQTYNKLSSPVDGLHQSTNPFGFTYVGDLANDCGITGGVTIPAISEYVYDGSSFIDMGVTQTLVISPGSVSLSTIFPPSKCLMVIPKPTSGGSIMNIYIAGPCSTTNFELEIDCPELLPSILSTTVQGSSDMACSGARTQTYYFASVTQSSTVGQYDYVFSDPYGSTPLADGWYGIDNGGLIYYIEVDNGIVININTCCNPGSTFTTIIDTLGAWGGVSGNVGSFDFLCFRVRSNNGAWSAPDNFGSNPSVTLNSPEFGACFEVEIGVEYLGNYYFPDDPGFPGWVWGNCATQYIAIGCIDRNTPPPLSTSPYMANSFTNPTFQPNNYMILMTPDPTTLYTNSDRYGTIVNSYWRFTVTQKAWIGGTTVVTDPLLGPVGPVTNVKLWIYEPI